MTIVSFPVDGWRLQVRQSAARLLARPSHHRSRLLQTDVNRVFAVALVDRGLSWEAAQAEAARFYAAVKANLAFHGVDLEDEARGEEKVIDSQTAAGGRA